MGHKEINISIGVHRQLGGWVLGWSVGYGDNGGSSPYHHAVTVGDADDETDRKRWWELRAAACDGSTAFEAMLTTSEKASGWDPLTAGQKAALVSMMAKGQQG